MVFIGSDHGGFELKEHIISLLKEENVEFLDCGTYTKDGIDYPDVAKDVCEHVQANQGSKGVLLCGTGVGMSICANKYKGIRAAVCCDTYSTKMCRMHNDANVLCMGQRVVGNGLALDILQMFLTTEFEGGRHKRRVDKIGQAEKQ